MIEKSISCQVEADSWREVRDGIKEVLPLIDSELSSNNVSISVRPQRAFEILDKTVLEVSDRTAFRRSPVYSVFLNIITDWYKERYGEAMKDDEVGIVAAILLHGTPFLMKVPRVFKTTDELDSSCLWIGVPAVVQREEKPLDWILQQDVVEGLSSPELQDAQRLALDTAKLVRSIGFDIAFLEWESSTNIVALARSVRADLQGSARSLCERDNASLRSSAWLSSQATEKAFKLYVAGKGEVPPHNHDLFALAMRIEKLGARPINRKDLLLIPSGKQASEIRYGGETTVSVTYEAYMAALSVVSQVLFDAKPEKKIDVRNARLKMKLPPSPDFDIKSLVKT